MRKLILNNGGRKASNDDWRALQQQSDLLMRMYAQAGPFVVEGLLPTQTGTNLWSLSPGTVFLNGQLIDVPSAITIDTTAGARGLAMSTTDVSPRVYAAAATQPGLREYTVQVVSWNSPVPGTGEIIEVRGDGSTRRLRQALTDLEHHVGDIRMWAGDPAGKINLTAGVGIGDFFGWVLADGQARPSDFTATVDLKGRVPVGVGTQDGLATGDTTNTYTLGQEGGRNTVLLTSAESGVPAHTHNYIDNTGQPSVSIQVGTGANQLITPGTNSPTNISFANAPQNAAQAHENRMPFTGVYFLEWRGTRQFTKTV